MQIADIEQILHELNAQCGEIMLSMLVSSDGLPLCVAGQDNDFELKGALCIELQLLCNRILAELGCGAAEEIFIRSRQSCIVIWPVGDQALLACMAEPSINTNKLQMLAWKTVSRLLLKAM